LAQLRSAYGFPALRQCPRARGQPRNQGKYSHSGWYINGGQVMRRKREVVLRLLRGEPLDAVSREVGVEVYRLEQWRIMRCGSRMWRWR